MIEPTTELEPISRAEDTREGNIIDFLDVFLVLTRRRKSIAGIVLAGAALSALLALTLPKYYEARTSLLPPQSSRNDSGLLAGQLVALTGINARDLGMKTQNDLYIGILKSESVASALVARFQLKTVYGVETLVSARTRLAKLSDISSGKDGLIVVAVQDRDPRRAADLANGYVEELQRLSRELALTEAGERRLFFQEELKRTKQELDRAGAELAETQRRTGVIDVEANAKALVEQIGVVRAQLAAKEAEAQSMRSFATNENPDLRFIEQQASALRIQLARLERGSGDGQSGSTGKLSAGAVEYAAKWRDLKYQETLFELLAKQYEAARLDEAKEGTVFQVLDRAQQPEKHSRPKRLLIMAAGTLFFALVGIVAALVEGSARRALEDPARSCKLMELRDSWSLLRRSRRSFETRT